MSEAFAPSNIALIKYWGKRDLVLNLPETSSLSIGLGSMGARTIVEFDHKADHYFLNEQLMPMESKFSRRLKKYLDSFRQGSFFTVKTTLNIPMGAGLASSACGFAALVLALADLLEWQKSLTELSVLARLGSGSACRSLWPGFVEWHRGDNPDGSDSHGEPLPIQWPDFRIGLLILDPAEKKISSRDAMEHTIQTSPFYPEWPKIVQDDLKNLKNALKTQDFATLGAIAEANALSMHALMSTARPAVCYSQPATLTAQQQIWHLRQEGLPLYFTQDAGPNLKLLFEKKHTASIREFFPSIKIIAPFAGE